MDETKNLTCIVCPLGCRMKVSFKDGEVSGITGFTCKKGKEYAENEITNPMRTLTTTIRIEGGEIPVLPVKTKEPVKKEMLFEMMKAINKVKVKAPVSIKQVIITNILNTGTDIIATRNVKKI